MPQFNPSRLDLARKRRGITKGELAEKLGLRSTRVLVAYEHGEKSPTDLTVRKMSEVLQFPEAFFYGTTIEEPTLEGASFRSLKRLTAQQRDKALASAALALQLSDWIDAEFKMPDPDLPRFQGISSEMAAASVRSHWQIGERPVKNVVHLLESHGVRVFSLTDESRDLDAFSFWRRGRPFVFLNTSKSAEHSRMDAAHELGHLVLHWKGGIRGQGRSAEHEAEQFGSAFLMPKNDLIAQAPRRPALGDLIIAKRRWNVSVAALTYRMHVLGLLSDWQYRSLFIELSKKGYRKREPQGSHGERSQALDKVFSALRSEGVSKAELARRLTLPVDEMLRSVFGLVLTSLEGERLDGPVENPGQRPTLRIIG